MRRKCFIYVRVSTSKQADGGISIPDQLNSLRRFAADNDLDVEEEFADRGRSARSGNRPEFQRMIAACLASPPEAEVILVYTSSRFYRDEAESEVLIRKLARNGVELKSATQDFGSGSTASLVRRISALLDEAASEETAKHVRRGLRENARQGFWCGSRPPLGYRVKDAEKRGVKIKKRLEVDEPRGEIVKTVFRLAIEGDGASGPMGIKAIVLWLNAVGARTDEGRKFSVGRVHRMLHTEAYTGTFFYGRFDTANRRELPENEWIPISIPPLISKEQYARVQRLLWERRPDVTAPRVTNSALILGGIARCKACGATMGLQTGKSHTGMIHRYYTCSAHLKSGACKGHAPVRVPASKLEGAVLKVLTENVFVPAFVQTVVKRVVDGRARDKAYAVGSVDRLKAELTRVEKGLRAMMDAITSGLIGDDDIFRQKYVALQEERKEAQRLIGMHERNLARSLEPLTDIQAVKAAQRLKEMLLAAAPKLQRRFVRALVGEVVVGPNVATVIGPQTALAEVASNTPLAEAAQASYPQVRGSVLGWCG